ncbi:MAG: extracellular solute-binding protein [Butyrivibrio sp.]|nr:extracellular solute-binding protein [Acetatifactor muris]MCM1561660.1 extracellular solute-binding protein [Butyrivibrio sp.]
MKGKKYMGLIAAVLLAVLTGGCSGKEDGNAGAAVSDTGLLQIAGDQLYLGEYTRLLLRDPVPVWEYQDKFLYADIFEDTVYILAEYRGVEGEEVSRQFFLTTYSKGVTELAWQPFELDFPEKDNWSIRSLAMPEEGKLSFRVLDGAGGAEPQYFLAETDLEGNLLSLADPFPEDYLWNPVSAINEDAVARGADGSMVLCDTEGEEALFYSCDPEGGSRKQIKVSADFRSIYAMYPEEDLLYLVDNSRHLFRWDNKAKKLTDMMSLQEINYPVGPDFAFLMPDGQDKLLLGALSSQMLQVFSLSEQEYQPEDEIRMAILRNSSTDYILEGAVEYSFAHWSCPITTESAEEDQEDAFRNRIMAEIAGGKGPDLMLVSADDLAILEEKGVLMDLTELIPEETLEQIFPCVIQEGTVNGKMVGLTLDLMIDTMLTADVTWPGETWNLEEFMQLLEEHEEWELPIQEYIVPITPIRCLEALLPNLCHSGYLDLEAGVARFEDEGFIRILEICKRYGDLYDTNRDSSGEGGGERLMNQECAARVTWVYDLDYFSELVSEYDGRGHLVGYPSDGSGHFMWSQFSYLAVNAESEHKEEIRDYIALLLDYDRQLYRELGIGVNIRRDVVRDSVVMVDGVPKLIYTIAGNTSLADLRYLKPDGSTYLEEFMDLLENCEVKDKWPAQITQILTEEMEPYLQGDRTAKEAAKLIQNRVQLYLDEQ